MLLRDSEIAKEVRTQLLNVEEKAARQIELFRLGQGKYDCSFAQLML